MPHYALIDCAVDPALYPMILREGRYKCLFAGAIDPDLVTAAPHIVELRQGSELYNALMTEGWGRNWGIVCAAEAGLWDVRKMLRGNLQAVLPDGKVVLFRFYDPRVFAPYIEACTPEEAAAWFGPVSDYWVATAEGTVHYGPGQGGVQRTLMAPAPAG